MELIGTSRQKKRYRNWFLSVVVLILLLLCAILLSLSMGEVDVPLNRMVYFLQQKEGIEYAILAHLRIPRTLLAFAVGGALSLSGTLLQGVYRNPLVEPYTLGISGGAALGVSLCIVLGVHLYASTLAIPLFGLSGALGAIFLVYTISMRRKRAVNINKMLLIGVMISFIASSGMLFFMSITTSENLQSIIFWMMGSLNEPSTLLIRVALFVSVAGLLISYLYVTPLNALRLGEVKAQHLGVKTISSVRAVFIIASIMTGVSVAVTGVIGFVGLIIPHLIRYLISSDYRVLLLASFLGGAIFLIVSDILARTIISPNELPIGVITGLLGGIVFIFALSKKFKTN